MKTSPFITLSITLLTTFSPLSADENADTTASPKFEQFTGKVARNKVRLRAQPSIEGPVIRELLKNDMLVVVGEEDDFFAVRPPSSTKGFIFRPYVLDGIIEGQHVNVRLEPDTDSFVIGQLNTGDKVEGQISSRNSRWYEITIPENMHFYVAKEFIENVGSPGMITERDKRHEEAETLLQKSYSSSDEELGKPFKEIDLASIYKDLETVINNYAEFGDQVEQAKTLKSSLQQEYLNKKIAYLESMRTAAVSASPTPPVSSSPNGKMLSWLPVEEQYFAEWTDVNGEATLTEFYENEKKEALSLVGVVEPYPRPVRNKPGDYILVNKVSRLPIAFLYSTKVDLDEWIGQNVSLLVTPRNNNNFAFPAYFVLEVQ